jgi:glycosyltransferase involved in cell wall biosynthesis
MSFTAPTRAAAHAPTDYEADLSRWTLRNLSVVLPCADEELNVADAIRAATRAAAEHAAEFEIVVVDDGSTDATAAVVDRMRDENPHVRLVVHTSNRGYGAAVRTGLAAARMDWVLLTDADLQFDLHSLEDFVPHAGSSDLVVGWRVMRQDPLGQRVAGAVWNWLMRRIFGLPVRDVDCAFKLVRRDLVASEELTSNGAMINAELVARGLAAGGRLTEVPVRHRPRLAGRHSRAGAGVIVRAFRELIGLHRRLARLPGGAPA